MHILIKTEQISFHVEQFFFNFLLAFYKSIA